MPPIDLADRPERSSLATPRRRSILASASRAFAAAGFRGSSLRDIATEAGVSLTLVNHYFGSKAQLLQAVVDNHHDVCRARMVGLAALVIGDDGPVPLGTLVTEWVRYEYDLYTSPEGEHYLILMLKLSNESEIDVSVQQRLNCSEPVVLRGFERASPDRSKAVRLKAFRASSAALHAGIIDYGVALDEGRPDARSEAIDFSTRFLLAGLAESLG